MPLLPNEKDLGITKESPEKESKEMETKDKGVFEQIKTDSDIDLSTLRTEGKVDLSANLSDNPYDLAPADDGRVVASTAGVAIAVGRDEAHVRESADLGLGLTVKTFGCGGFGRTMVDKLAYAYKDCDFVTIDATTNDQRHQNVTAMSIPGLAGSGAIRAKNYAPIKEWIAKSISEIEFAELNIFVCSCAGGSGSVIAPLLMKEAYRQGKHSILVTSVDKRSEIACRNSVNSLASFESMIGNEYIPIVLFDNGVGMKVVDNGIAFVFAALNKIMAGRYDKLDPADRMAFLSPSTGGINVKAGMKLLGISCDPTGAFPDGIGLINPADEGLILDSMLTISRTGSELQSDNLCNLSYSGYHNNDNNEVLSLSLGAAVPGELIGDYNKQLLVFKQAAEAQQVERVSLEKDIAVEQQSDGMVL